MVSKKTISLIVPAFLMLLTTLASCKKEAPTLAKIYVHDTDGNPFPNAEVRVYGEPTVTPHPAVVLDETSFSDADGSAIFDFTDRFNLGQAGYTVLTIEINSGDTLFAEGIIKVEEEKLNIETLIIQPL